MNTKARRFMTTEEITPGPWELQEEFTRRARIVPARIPDTFDSNICIVEMPQWKDAWRELSANAHAIAAVPEMLKALEALQAALQIDKLLFPEPPAVLAAMRLADVALRKASGQDA